MRGVGFLWGSAEVVFTLWSAVLRILLSIEPGIMLGLKTGQLQYSGGYDRALVLEISASVRILRD